MVIPNNLEEETEEVLNDLHAKVDTDGERLHKREVLQGRTGRKEVQKLDSVKKIKEEGNSHSD